MQSAPETPLVSTTTADVVETERLTPQPDSSVNFAEDAAVKLWVETNLLPLIEHTRGQYNELHAEWENIRRMTNLVRDGNAAYSGQSKAYLPVYQRALETRVSHTSRGLFPSDSYFDAVPNVETPEAEAAKEGVKGWMSYELETAAKLRAELKPFLRNVFNYGGAVAKVWWEKTPTTAKRTRMASLPGISELLMDYGKDSTFCEGLRFRARNPFSWYAWPMSINSIAEASLVFEDIQVGRQFIDAMGRLGHWKNIDQLLSAGGPRSESENGIRQGVREVGGGEASFDKGAQGDLADWKLITESWLRMPVPDRLYLPGEEKGTPVPVKVVTCGAHIIECRRNPFWHQQTPYLMFRLNENVDSFYSTGMGRASASLQYLINDFVNQTNDNGIYALNPIVKVNPNLIVGPLEPLAPGRVWNLTDPAGAVFDRPPVEQIQYGQQIIQMLISFLNDMSGAPAVLQGSGDRGGAKTATGAQILQGNVKGDLQDIIEDIELRVMMPLMQMAHSLGQQFERAERFMAIGGGQKVQFKPGMLELDYAWRWVASSQNVNQQMRAQQLGQFMQLAGNPQILQMLAAQGKTLNPEPILRKFWEDGLGQRNFGTVITPLPMMPGMMGPGMPPQGPQQPQGAPQQPRSAVEQAPAGTDALVPGEAEAFGEVRAGADDLAALLGGMNG